MKKHQSLAVFGVLTSALLMGCDGDLDLSKVPGNENPNSNAMNVRMPKSLQASDDTTDESNDQSTGQSNEDPNNNSDSPAVTKEAVKDVGTIVDGLDAAAAGAPSQALYLGADLLSERVEFAQETLSEIDNVWEQITSYCASVADGEKCEIPAGTLTGDSAAVDAEDTDQLLAMALTYQGNPGENYDHSLTRKFEEDFTEIEQLRWNADRSLISMSFESSWQDEDGSGTQSSNLHYSGNSEGDQISLRDEFTMDDSKFTDFQQLHQLNDGLNGVEMKAEFNWSDAYSSGKWQSHAVANDEGGKLVTTASFDDEDSIWHSRETFDDDGELVSSEYCEQSEGIDCGEPANWTSEELDGAVEFVDFDIESAGDGLEEAYEIACSEMDIDESECGFSETDMVMLHGAFDIYDNTEDVTVYLCIETGEDELACRAQDSDQIESVIEEGAIESQEFTIIEGDDSGIVTQFGEHCSDCETDNDVNEAFEGLVDGGDFEDFIELLEPDQDESNELDLVDSIGNISDSVYDCEINDDGEANCDFEGESTEVVDAGEIPELPEGHDCFAAQDDNDSASESNEGSNVDASACLSALIDELGE